MAQAIRKQREIKPVVAKAMEDYIELKLTPYEARIILQLVGSTYGDAPEVQEVHRALSHLGLPASEYRVHGLAGLWSIGHTPEDRGVWR